jgi:hypothetical protein
LAGPSDPVIKRLFAVSSNRCAFPACTEPLVEGETVVGEVCHIRSAREGHPRYDPKQAEAERNGFDNLILLCRKHHKIVDTEVDCYPPALLTEMKKAHEARPSGRVTVTDDMVQRLGKQLSAISEIMLLEAARRAYSETRNYAVAAHAEMSDATPDNILIEPVTIDNPTKDFDLKDDTLTLRERYGSAVWENLRVKFDELPAIIEDLKGYGK